MKRTILKQMASGMLLAAGLLGPGSLGLGVFASSPVYAHHSLSLFDREATVTLTGIVREFQWTNPHVWIEVVADGEDGMVSSWSIQGSAPTILARGGWRPSALKPGDMISLGVHPRKDGSVGGYLADAEALWVNGHELIAPLIPDRAPSNW